MIKLSLYADCEQEIQRFKWIVSEKAGRDVGEPEARRQWLHHHWNGFLRSRWLEHLEGKRFWVELDRGDFGFFQNRFEDQRELLGRIIDKLKVGQENLDIVVWAVDTKMDTKPVLDILEALDINSRRLCPKI